MNESGNQGSSLPSPSTLLSGVTPTTTLMSTSSSTGEIPMEIVVTTASVSAPTSQHMGHTQDVPQRTYAARQASTQIHISQADQAVLQQARAQHQMILQSNALSAHQQSRHAQDTAASSLPHSQHGNAAVPRAQNHQQRSAVSVQQAQQYYTQSNQQAPNRIIPSQNSSFQPHPSQAGRPQGQGHQGQALQAHPVIHSGSQHQPQHITIRQQAQSGVATIAGVGGQPVLLVQQPRATLHRSTQGRAIQELSQCLLTSQLLNILNELKMLTTVVVQQTLPQQPQLARGFVQAPVPAANVYIGSQRYYSTLLAERSRDPNAPTPKQEYRELKRKFKYLVYENECYQEELRNLQRKLLKLSRDKNFLLDRLANYENASESSEDSDASTKTIEDKAPKQKKKPTAKPKEAKKKGHNRLTVYRTGWTDAGAEEESTTKEKTAAVTSVSVPTTDAAGPPPPSPTCKVVRLSPSALNESLTRSGAIPMVELNEQKMEIKDEEVEDNEARKSIPPKAELGDNSQASASSLAPV
ncbi:coiled-coil domain containing 95-like protein [Aphelenchoides avenae]|nr:coiled-coil domain containing 95-like protein [Aphelenchus avenae]